MLKLLVILDFVKDLPASPFFVGAGLCACPMQGQPQGVAPTSEGVDFKKISPAI